VLHSVGTLGALVQGDARVWAFAICLTHVACGARSGLRTDGADAGADARVNIGQGGHDGDLPAEAGPGPDGANDSSAPSDAGKSEPGHDGGPACAKQLALGIQHSCALQHDSSVWCWGRCDSAQCGNPANTANWGEPNLVLGGASTLTAGGDHSCALMPGGKVMCWGANNRGELGPGTSNGQSHTPLEVGGLGAGVTSIAAGVFHTCATKTDGSTWCWGWNEFGQLGNGVAGGILPVPAQVVGLPLGVVRVAGGGHHSCAISTDGQLWCWGANGYGQLGIGTTGPSIPSPQLVKALGNSVVDVALGFHHSCALRKDKTLWCWGWNNTNQLGMVGGPHDLPVQVAGLDHLVDSVVASTGHTCTVDTSGVPRCWGYNWYAQLGLGNKSLPVAEPSAVVGIGLTLEIAAGETHTCARLADDSIVCWGGDLFGQLGDGQETDVLQLEPVSVHLSCQ
jgi:alpha-tubulin suppressor-like RCC1 family protein